MTSSTHARIAGLGHVGLYATDLDVLLLFYTEVLGLTLTDGSPADGKLFLSAQPEYEHHELLFIAGRPSGSMSAVNQVSFYCDHLEDLIEIHRRLREREAPIDMVVSHGNAIGVYFHDPEGNRIEAYWRTGIPARQPYLEGVDLDRPPEEITAAVADSVAAHGGGPYVDANFVAARR